MLAIFGAGGVEGTGIFAVPIFKLVIVLLAIFIFFKFCGWAKTCKLSGGAKKLIMILTGVGAVVFNLLYSKGNAAIVATGDWNSASIALVAAMVWVFIFAYALMAETK
ncbi:MAG: hypothetical protein ABFC94_01900 [Syntrophomonas sp.]